MSFISVVSNYDNAFSEIGILSDQNKLMYCKKHGYDCHLFNKKFDNRPAAWSKIAAIMEVLPKYDWVFWSDADAAFMNHEIKLESFIDDRCDLVICKELHNEIFCKKHCGANDWHKKYGYRILNTGNFFIKNSEIGKYILKCVWENKYPDPAFWDQGALLGLIRNEPYLLERIKIFSMNAFNSHPFFELGGPYQEGDFIMHFFWYPYEEKKVLYKKHVKLGI